MIWTTYILKLGYLISNRHTLWEASIFSIFILQKKIKLYSRSTTAIFHSYYHSFYTPITSDNVMLDFICMGLAGLRAACEKRNNTKWKFLSIVGLESASLTFIVRPSNDWASLKVMNLKKGLLLRCIHHFESDLIHNMDHMHISGTEHSSVILSQTK